MLWLTMLAGCSGKRTAGWVKPTVAPITEAVFATGHVEPLKFFTLTALNEGYLRQSLVQEGQQVQANQLLFVQDQQSNTIQEQAARENLAIARQNVSSQSPVLQQWEAQLQAAQEKLRLDQRQLERMQRLAATRSVAGIELEKARLTYENSQHSVESLQASLRSAQSSLQQALVSSQSQYQTARATNGYSRLVSPHPCKVYEIFKKEGELVRKGEAIATLGDAHRMQVILTIDESSIAKVRPGQRVLLELNTAKGQTLTGTISRIYPYFNEQLQSYRAEAVFDSQPSSLIAGTLLQANVLVNKKSKALLIPRASLNSENRVIRKTSNGQDTVSIRTGIVSTDWVEVLEGINPTDQVQKPY
jgi:multidrug efflux pump subunit AcrA (membrane-fusion protein)